MSCSWEYANLLHGTGIFTLFTYIYCTRYGFQTNVMYPYSYSPSPIRCTSLGFPALQDTSEEEPTLDVAPLISDAKVTSALVGGAAVGRAWLRIWGVLVACKQVTTLLMERNPANQSDMSHDLPGFHTCIL